MNTNDLANKDDYLFTIGENRDITYSAKNSNLSGFSLGETPFFTRVKDIYIPGNKIENDPLSVTFLLSKDLKEWIYFVKWITKIKNNTSNFHSLVKPCEILTRGINHMPGIRCSYYDCWPMAISGIDYESGDGENLTFDVTFRFNVMKVTLPNGEVIDDDWDGEI